LSNWPLVKWQFWLLPLVIYVLPGANFDYADPLFALSITPGARFTKQTYKNFYPKFLVKQSYNVLWKKNTLKEYDLQESYNNFKINLKIFFCESGPRFLSVPRRGGSGSRPNLWQSINRKNIEL